MNGMRGRSNDFVLDGMPMNVRQYGVINFEPSNEAVREFELKASAPQAEFGGTLGATVNIITRMGTNQFHGSLYEFFRNDVLDSNSTFSTRAGLPRGKLRQNQFGGSIGGPIFSNKHFFFGNFEQLRILEGVETRLVSVPTPEERNGLIRYRDAGGRAADAEPRRHASIRSARGCSSFYPQPNAGTRRAVELQLRADHRSGGHAVPHPHRPSPHRAGHGHRACFAEQQRPGVHHQSIRRSLHSGLFSAESGEDHQRDDRLSANVQFAARERVPLRREPVLERSRQRRPDHAVRGRTAERQ